MLFGPSTPYVHPSPLTLPHSREVRSSLAEAAHLPVIVDDDNSSLMGPFPHAEMGDRELLCAQLQDLQYMMVRLRHNMHAALNFHV